MPSTVPACRSLLTGGGGIGGGGTADFHSAADAGSSTSERLSRSGSTSVMSVSEFYGPSGARMLQRRSSTASQLSLADSYGEGETMDSASATKENKEGQAALSSLMAAGAAEAELQLQQQQQQQQRPQQSTQAPPQGHSAAVGVGVGGVVQAGPPATTQAPLPAAATAGSAVPSAWSTLTWPPGQQQAFGAAEAASATGGVGGEVPGPRQQIPQPPGALPPLPEAVPNASLGAQAASVSGLAPAVVAGLYPAGPVPGEAAVPPVAAEVAGSSVTQDPAGLPPPLTLDAPHPGASDKTCATSLSSGAGAACSTPTTVQQQPRSAGDAGGSGPASSLSLPWISSSQPAPSTAAQQPQPQPRVRREEPMPEDAASQPNQRVGLLRAMSVDSAPSPARPHARTLSFPGGGTGGGGLGSTSGSESFGITVQVPPARSTSGGGGPTVHSPRLRAQSMDSGGRKGKSKRGKGPGSAVMGKADRIGRMLQVSGPCWTGSVC